MAFTFAPLAGARKVAFHSSLFVYTRPFALGTCFGTLTRGIIFQTGRVMIYSYFTHHLALNRGISLHPHPHHFHIGFFASSRLIIILICSGLFSASCCRSWFCLTSPWGNSTDGGKSLRSSFAFFASSVRMERCCCYCCCSLCFVGEAIRRERSCCCFCCCCLYFVRRA